LSFKDLHSNRHCCR